MMNQCVSQGNSCSQICQPPNILNDIDPIYMKDPILEVDNKLSYPIIHGADANTYQPYDANSASTSSVQWNIDVPNMNTLVDRRMYFEFDITVSMTGPDPGQKLFQSGYEGFREYPLASATNTIQVQLNNQTVSAQLSNYIHPLQKYMMSRDFRDTYLSATPNMTDYYQEYADGLNTAKNPLSQYTGSSYELPRGAYISNTVIDPANNTNTVFTATFTIREPLFLSPFQFGDVNDRKGFLYLNNINVVLTLENQLFNRMWSRSSGANPISTSSITFPSTPRLLIRYLSLPSPDICKLPSKACYDYFNIQSFSQNISSVASNASTILTSRNIQLQNIPDRIYIFARERNADLNANVTRTDTTANISNISINFDNRSGILSSAREIDLYKIACRNGYKYSFMDWHGLTFQNVGGSDSVIGLQGSVLCLRPGQDFSLNDKVPGQLGQYNFQYTMTIKNVNQTRSINFDLYTIVLNRGIFTIHCNGIAELKNGIVDNNVVNSARYDPFACYCSLNKAYGGSFLGEIGKDILSNINTVGDVFRNIGNPKKALGLIGNQALRNVTAFPRHLGEAVKDVTGLVNPAKMIGLGKKKRGRPKKKKGGNSISKQELYRRLMR